MTRQCPTCFMRLVDESEVCPNCSAPAPRPAPPATLPPVAPPPPVATAPPQYIYVPVPAAAAPAQQRQSAVQGCAQAIAGMVLFVIGVFLLLFAPILGVFYFGVLVVIALLRVLLR